jgi:hypothetical protein
MFFRTDGEYAPITFFANCGDLFYWATSDLEKITPENVEILEQSFADASFHGDTLFCARVRKMRPQGACYKHWSADLQRLFDACGPAREVDKGPFGNPIHQSKYANPKETPCER